MKTIDLVKEYLAQEGYRYEIDNDGDVHFKYQGVNLFFTDSGNDSNFFRIIMPSIYDVDNNRVKVLEAANTVTRDIKVLKAFLVGDHLWLSIEIFIDSTPELADFFPRCLDILYEGRRRVAAEIFKD
jgi:hypothetical protein